MKLSSAYFKLQQRAIEDPASIIEDFFYIIDKNQRKVPFFLNDVQRKYLKERTWRDVILKARKEGLCLSPETKILTSDLRWKTLEDVVVGEEIVAVDETPPEGRGKIRLMKNAIVEAKRVVTKPAFKITTEDGRCLIATKEHRFLCRRGGRTQSGWKEVGWLRVGDKLRYITTPWEEASSEDFWFSGLADGEGSLRQKNQGGVEYSVCQTEGAVLNRILNYVKNNGLSYRIETDNRKYYKYEEAKIRRKKLKRIVFNRMNEIFVLMGKTRPSRFIDRKWWVGKGMPGKNSGKAWEGIVSIEPLGTRKMIDLQTSAKTFIAEGFVSHNSSVISALFTVDFLFRPNTYCVVISHEITATEKLFNRVKFFIDSRERPDIIPVDYGTTRSGEIFNRVTGSRFYLATGGSRAFGRGEDIHRLHISEAAHFHSWSMVTGAVEAVPAESKETAIIFETTANGRNPFYSFYRQAGEGGSIYTKHFYGWQEAKEYQIEVDDEEKFLGSLTQEEKALKERYNLNAKQLNWRRTKIASIVPLPGFSREETFKQEFPSCISGEAIVSSKHGTFPFFQRKDLCKGENVVYEVKTYNGYSVKATDWHLFRLADDQWKSLKELVVGDKIRLLPPYFSLNQYQEVGVDYEVPLLKGKIKIDEEMAEFLGLFFGDGSIYKDKKGGCFSISLAFDAKDEDVIKKYEDFFDKNLGGFRRRTIGDNGGRVELRKSNRYFKEIFLSLGVARLKGNFRKPLRVPSYIFSSPPSVIAAFLRGLFDSDGHISYKYPTARFFSQSNVFIKEVQLLLLGLGITSRTISIEKRAGDGHLYLGNELQLRRKETEKFMKDVGFISNRKQNRWAERKETGVGRRYEIKLEDRIVSINRVGTELVYDMGVEPERYYSANGFFVHNSENEAFIFSGNPYFSIEALAEYQAKCQKPTLIGNLEGLPPHENIDKTDSGYLKLYDLPKSNEEYLISADVASFNDYSVAIVIEKKRWRVVAKWRGKINAGQFGDELNKLGHYFNRCLIVVEANNMGQSTVDRLKSLDYPSLYQRERFNETEKKITKEYGWWTDGKTKPLMLGYLQELIRTRQIEIPDEEIISELQTYSRKPNGELGAAEGSNDDCVIATAIGFFVLREYPYTGSYNAGGGGRSSVKKFLVFRRPKKEYRF